MVQEKYVAFARQIVQRIGGKENVQDLTHCVTRLRFRLKDDSLADTEGLKSLDGVLTVVKGNGQYQVVVGNIVDDVFDTIVDLYQIKSTITAEAKPQGNILMRAMNQMSAILNPIVIALAGAGMIKALLVILTTTLNVLDTSGSTYKILAAAGNSVFYFLPLFLAVSSAKAFHANPFISLAIVGALMEPNFTGLMKQNGDIVDFLGVPVVMMKYSATLVPAILAVLVYAKLEQLLKRIVPKNIEIFALSFAALLIMVPLSVIVIGPIGVTLANVVGDFVNMLSAQNGLLTGLVIGACWTLLVMVGIHWGVVPIMINNITTLGYDFIRPMVAAATFASAGAAFGVFLRAKDKKTKAFALSTTVPALLGGITEPIVYGISLRYKKPLLAQIIGGGIAGAFMGAMHTKAIVYVFPAITTLPAFIGENFWYYVTGIILSFTITAMITYALGIDEAPVGDEQQIKKSVGIHACANGAMVNLSDVKDEVFASKAMGDGVAIVPDDGVIYAPTDATVVMAYPTGHAIGLQTDEGIEMLLHIGINTVELNGKGFEILVKSGQKVRQGDKLIEFDVETIRQAGYDATVMQLVTNMKESAQIHLEDKETVDEKDEIMKLEWA